MMTVGEYLGPPPTWSQGWDVQDWLECGGPSWNMYSGLVLVCACSEILPHRISKHGKSGRVFQRMYSLSKLKHWNSQTQEVRSRGKGNTFWRELLKVRQISDHSYIPDHLPASPTLPLVFPLCCLFLLLVTATLIPLLTQHSVNPGVCGVHGSRWQDVTCWQSSQVKKRSKQLGAPVSTPHGGGAGQSHRWKVPLPMAGGWTKLSLNIPSHPNHSMTQFCT